MADFFFEGLRVAAAMFLLLAAWAAFLHLVRRQSGCANPDRDPLDFMLHGCGGGCAGSGNCKSRHESNSTSRKCEAPNETF